MSATAGLVVLLLAGGIWLKGLLVDRLTPVTAGATVVPGVSSDSPMDRGHIEELSGRDLIGIQIVGGYDRLVVSKVTVQSGAEVTFRAGKAIAFGNGFRVASGATIRVEPETSGGRASHTSKRDRTAN